MTAITIDLTHEVLDENIRAVLVDLTPDDLRDIDDAVSKIAVQAARYPEKLEQMMGRLFGASSLGDRANLM